MEKQFSNVSDISFYMRSGYVKVSHQVDGLITQTDIPIDDEAMIVVSYDRKNKSAIINW